MLPNKVQDQDLLTLFSELINDEAENEIFKIIFSESDEEKVLEKLINHMETGDDQD
jgi:hypothetical protein